MQIGQHGSLGASPLPRSVRPAAAAVDETTAGDAVEIRSLEHPPVEMARHRRPVVVIHGTIVKKDSVQAYHDFFLKQGHPVEFQNYPTITDGAPIQQSAQLVSQDINRARVSIARDNMVRLMSANPAEWKKFFQIDGNLYGSPDPKAEKLLDQVPWLLKQVDSVLQLPGATLTQDFSSRMSKVESGLADRLGKVTDWSPRQRTQVAAEMVDSLAPKATLVGHSAGGFVAYTLAVNPRQGKSQDQFSYDGGLGVANVIVLSSPIGEGMSEPAPPAMADKPFYDYVDSPLLQPLEKLPASQLAMANPLTAYSYALAKSSAKAAWNAATMMTIGMSTPLIFAAHPGYEQVTGSSSFFNEYVKGKEIPQGVTVLSVTSPDDKMSLAERSQADDSQPNGHNLSFDLKLAPGELERERPTWAHVKMGTLPEEFKTQFRQDLLAHPERAARYLDSANNDDSRYEVLEIMQDTFRRQPQLLDQTRFSPLKDAIEAVAAEKMPFRDAPSALAAQILA